MKYSNRIVIVAVAVIGVIVLAAAYVAFVPTVKQPQVFTKLRFILNFGAIDGHHIPYFVALDKGWYNAEGLDVEIIPGKTSAYAVEQVGAGNADMGVATADVIISGVTRGAPVKSVYLLFQNNPAGVAALANLGVKGPADLVGKKVGAQVGATQDLQFDILIKKMSIDASKIDKVPISFDVVAPLATGRVHAIQIWATDIPNLRAAGVNVTAFFYRDFGLNFYSLAIFSNEQFIKAQPETIRKFVKVTDQAIRWTMDHPGEGVDIIMKYTSFSLPRSRSILFQRLELSLQLMQPTAGATGAPSLDAKLGLMNRSGWSQIQDLLFDFGKIKEKVNPDIFFTTQFLPT